MILVRLKGGMGNQMFQYAFGKAVAAKLGTKMQMDLSVLLDRSLGDDFVYRDFDLDIFDLTPNFYVAPSVLRKVYKLKYSKVSDTTRKLLSIGKHYEKEANFEVDRRWIKAPRDNTIYDGWWQSGKYFDAIAPEIRKDFQFKDKVLPESRSILDRIQSTNSVCLNVRRTDFLTDPILNATNLEYFLKAAKRMGELVENPHFFVFSDDTRWCTENILLDAPVEVVSHELKGRKFGNYLQLMIACKNFVIPNSSYAWWAVWLNRNQNKHVIAPRNWFAAGDFNTSDLVPENWIRM